MKKKVILITIIFILIILIIFLFKNFNIADKNLDYNIKNINMFKI